jgi:hypothetical protein
VVPTHLMQRRQFALDGQPACFKETAVAAQIASQRGGLGVFSESPDVARCVCLLKRHHEICELSTNACESALERGGGLRNQARGRARTGSQQQTRIRCNSTSLRVSPCKKPQGLHHPRRLFPPLKVGWRFGTGESWAVAKTNWVGVETHQYDLARKAKWSALP